MLLCSSHQGLLVLQVMEDRRGHSARMDFHSVDTRRCPSHDQRRFVFRSQYMMPRLRNRRLVLDCARCQGLVPTNATTNELTLLRDPPGYLPRVHTLDALCVALSHGQEASGYPP